MITRSNLNFLALLFAKLIFLTFATSVQAFMYLQKESDSPLYIEAIKTVEWDQSLSEYTAIGNAKISQDDHYAYGNQFKAFYRQDGTKKEIYLITGEKDIHLEHLHNHAYGQNLNYDLTKGILTLTQGDLKFTTPNYTVTALRHLAFHEYENKAVASGNAQAVKENSVIRADTIIAWLAANDKGAKDLTKAEAIGHVKITTPEDIAYGDRAEYFADQDKAFLYDHVKIIKGKNQIMGTKAVINLTTGESKMLSKQNTMGSDNKNTSNGRVKGIIRFEKDTADVSR